MKLYFVMGGSFTATVSSVFLRAYSFVLVDGVSVNGAI